MLAIANVGAKNLKDGSNILGGQFWIAGHPEDALPGFLDLSSPGPRLKLIGGFKDSRFLSDAVVHGRLSVQRPAEITLFNCYGGTTNVGSERAETSIESTVVGIGRHFLSVAEFGGIGIEFRLDSVAQWFGHNCFKFDMPKGDGTLVTIKYAAFEETTIPIDDDLSLTLVYRAQFAMGGWGVEELTVSRPLRLRLNSKSWRRFDELRMLATECKHFFVLLLGGYTEIEEPSLYVQPAPSGQDQGISLLQVKIFESHADVKHSQSKPSFDDYLLKFGEIETFFPVIVARWFSLYAKSRDALESFFSTFHLGLSKAPEEFVAAIAAIEELHRGSNPGARVALKRRLCDNTQRWAAFITTPVTEQLLTKIVDSRNYYSHRFASKREKAAHGFLLKRYTYFLWALMSLELLQRLGLGDTEISELTQSNWKLRECLNRTVFPGAEDSDV